MSRCHSVWVVVLAVVVIGSLGAASGTGQGLMQAGNAETAAGNTGPVTARDAESDTAPTGNLSVTVAERAGERNDSVLDDDAQFLTVSRPSPDGRVFVVVSKDSRYQPAADLRGVGRQSSFDFGGVSDAAGSWTVYAAETETPPEPRTALSTWADAETDLFVTNTSSVREPATDDTWSSGDVAWRGSDRFLKSDRVAADAGVVWALYEVREGGLVRASALPLDENAEAVIDTRALSGTYVVVSQRGRVLRFEDGRVVGRSPVTETPAVRRAAVRIRDQSLSVDARNATVATKPTTLSFDSNRGAYAVRVTADDLSSAELKRTVAAADPVRYDNGIRFRIEPGSERVPLDLSALDRGRYEFDISAVDSAADDSVIVVRFEREDVAAAFDDTDLATAEGGVVRLPIRLANADRATVAVGSESAGYLTTVRVVDDDGDGFVGLRMNTWLAGRSPAENERAFTAADGHVAAVSMRTESVADPPLDPVAYPVTVSVRETVKDRAAVAISNRSTEPVRVWTAPADEFGRLDSLRAVRSARHNGTVTRDKEVAQGDLAVFELSAPGLTGWLSARGTDDSPTRAFVDADKGDSAFDLEISRLADEPNGPPGHVDLRSTAAADGLRIVPDWRNGTLYLVLDTERAVLRGPGDDRRGLEAGDRFRANLTVSPANGAVDDTHETTSTWRVVERETAVMAPTALRPVPRQPIRGTSTAAPGTAVRIRVKTTADRTLRAIEPTVDANGRFGGTLNLSGVEPNTTVEISARESDATAVTRRVVNRPPAAVSLRNQSIDSTAHVPRVRIPSQGFVALYNATTFELVAVSGPLEAGTHRRVPVNLRTPENASRRVVAVAHADIDGDGRFDGPATDAAFRRRGDSVRDDAMLDLQQETDVKKVTDTKGSGRPLASTATPPGVDGPPSGNGANQVRPVGPTRAAVLSLALALGLALLWRRGCDSR